MKQRPIPRPTLAPATRKTQPVRHLAVKRELIEPSSIEDCQRLYGFDPTHVGSRHVNYWVVRGIGEDEIKAGAEKGDLCVKTMDTGEIPQDINAKARTNFVGTSTSKVDPRIRFYYFKPKFTAVRTYSRSEVPQA